MTGPVVIGVDIGGSKTEAVAATEADIVRTERFTSASITAAGTDAAERVLDSVAEAFGDLPVSAVCVGAAGADTAADRKVLQQMVGRRFPDAMVCAVHDARLVLAAAELDHGIVLVAGTGSVAWARSRDGREARAGGWGYLLGDGGSGYALALDAVRHALGEHDRRVPLGALSREVLAYTGIDDAETLLPYVYANQDRSYWATLANNVLDLAESGDDAAAGIRRAAVAALIDQVATVSRVCGTTGPVVLAGGLLVHRPELSAAVTDGLAAAGIGQVRTLDRAPAMGAVRLGRRLLLDPHSFEDKRRELNA